ncbi:MAG: DUF308 domain-containing protein [Solobacterium sp.]|jgi:uncharacterized membrane protein HdeD (DUF308 family)|nr:DUF308 domain-containing protein [Solobacterium sp.]MCH4222552.1 DUF308 domain-containing protein [Solobacterium sp.]MCH4265484.1 DUF308 domain-containing protein [Solobacterium sp.]
MRKRNWFDTLGSATTDLLLLAIGILFFLSRIVTWRILEIVFIIYSFYTPTMLIIRLVRKEKDADTFDYVMIGFDYAIAIIILLWPEMFFHFIHIFAGWWMIAHGFIMMVDFYVLKQDHLNGTVSTFLGGLISLLLGLFLVFSMKLAVKTWLLSIFAGIYFCFYGLIGLVFHLFVNSPRTIGKKRYNWSYSAPVLLNAFVPVRVYTSVTRLIHESALTNLPESDEPSCDLYVYNYLNDKGGEAFGHTDIAYKGTVYSYGCHDPKSRKLGGTLGDGVLIVADEKRFLNEALHGEKKIVIRYGIRLTDSERTILESNIKELMSRAVPWKCALAEADEKHETYTGFMDYASRVYQGSHANMYKFSRGKFRTYFAAGTNCTLLADELIRSNELMMIDINGLVTPGAYLSFLNTEYLKKDSLVVSRTLYKCGINEA